MHDHPRFLMIADVGGERARHVGDEAMLASNLEALRERFPRATFTIIAADPAWVRRHYGVDAVARPTIEVVEAADAVFVSGGGNLSSTWPELLHDRIELLELARRCGKPAIVLGQTIGPNLSCDERVSLGRALSYARFVGVREIPSALLALELGVPHERLWYQADDAVFPDARDVAKTQTIAVTIDPQVRGFGRKVFDALAGQLRVLASETGATLQLIPHAFGEGELSDLTEARLLAQRIGGDVEIAGKLDASEVRERTAAAQLVVSSRYHPIVFGLAAGVPCIAIYGDDYCRIKLQGALAHAQLEQCAHTYRDVVRGAVLPKARELWQSRDDVRSQLESRAASWCDERRARWDAVCERLEREPTSDASHVFGRPAAEVMPRLADAHAAQQRWADERVHEALRPRGLRRYAAGLRRRLLGE